VCGNAGIVGKRSRIIRQIAVNDENFGNRTNSTCVPCPEGRFTNPDKGMNCSEFCDAGFCPFVDNCTACGRGTFNDKDNATECSSCPPGSVAAWGATNCSMCSPGFTNNTVSSLCGECLAGTFNPVEGGTCLPCDPGQYSDQGSTGCLDCPKGSYSAMEGTPVCTPCGPGRYNPEVGQLEQSSCLICPTGYYCPFPMTEEPVACPTNFYCKAGYSLPVSCALLFESERTAESCHPQAMLYLIMLGSVALLVVIISVVVCIRTSRVAKPKVATERDKLIPQPLDGPVYEGL